FIAAALAQNSADLPVFLVTIEHADFAAPIRWCSGGADIVSNGRPFDGRAMKVTPPGDAGDRNGRRGRISVDNTTTDAIGKLRTATSRPDVTIEIVLAAYPDDIEFSWVGLKLLDQA